MTDVVTFLLSLAGFAALLLALPRHQQDWFGRKPSAMASRALRLSGCISLVLALAIARNGFGWAYGLIAWFGWLTIAAALVVTANTNRELIIRRIRK